MPSEFGLTRFRQEIGQYVLRDVPDEATFAKELTRKMRLCCGIIDAMTPIERGNPSIVLEDSRGARVARGAGVYVFEVNEYVKLILRVADSIRAAESLIPTDSP